MSLENRDLLDPVVMVPQNPGTKEKLRTILILTETNSGKIPLPDSQQNLFFIPHQYIGATTYAFSNESSSVQHGDMCSKIY